MDIKKLAPWNWFKKEEEEAGKTIPVKHGSVAEYQYPNDPVTQLHREIDRIFDDAFRSFGWPSLGFEKGVAGGKSSGIMKPTLDIGATDDAYTITVEVPGVDEKDVNIEVANDVLTIQGEKKQEKEEKEKNYYRMERSYGAFQRVLSLPEDADQDGIEATFKRGVLKIVVPRKSVPKPEVKRIEVKKAG